MKEANIVITSISDVHGGWDAGYYVEAGYHYEWEGNRDGFQNERVSLSRDRLVQADGGYDLAAVADMVRETIGETVEIG